MLRIFFAESTTAVQTKPLAHALLARAAREVWGESHLPPISIAPHGKPFFADFPARHFSLSHSGIFALCALSDAPVGADIEMLRPRRTALAAHIFSTEEAAWFAARGEQWPDFYALWTRKEALVKCTGEGLFCAPRALCVPLEPEQLLSGRTFHTWRAEAYCASVCGQTGTILPTKLEILRSF